MNSLSTSYITDIKQIISSAREQAYKAVNYSMTEAYWKTGKRIIEEEQKHQERAEYGKEVIKNLAVELTQEFGKGYSERYLYEFRRFYLTFQDFEILHTLCAKLNWSHFRHVLRVTDEKARLWYLKEAAEQGWAIKTLDRNISTMYYQRLLSSQVKEPVVNEMKKKTDVFQHDKLEFVKNPSVLEFMGLSANMAYTETDVEKAIIDHMQQFLLELGKGFAFVARQLHIQTDTQDFFIDLVFYNYILKCFVIIELKNEKMTHQAIGQLDMYVRMFDDLKKQEGDNPSIGILLCTETDKTIARYSVLNENKQLFASKYLPYLPSEQELVLEIERQKEIIQQQDDKA